VPSFAAASQDIVWRDTVGIQNAASNIASLQVTAKMKHQCVVLRERNAVMDFGTKAQDDITSDWVTE
jgi:hypothetical protein